jgi:RNA polymerase sigma-70 factor (ECF subfamily)
LLVSRHVTDHVRRRSEGVAAIARPLGSEGRVGVAGESWARFEALYRSSRDDVYAYVMTLLRDSNAAEDVTAQAFERAYRRRRSFDRRRGEERAWLFGIARNAALDELRRRRRLTALVVEPESSGDDDVAAAVDDDDIVLRRTAIRAALATLSARDREVIALKFHGGLSNSELAKVLGVSESNAGTILHRSVQKLRRAIGAPV